MPSLKNIRFQKYDAFNNPTFIASSTKSNESENYNVLSNYANKLEKKEYDTYLPIYKSDKYNYSTIRFKKDPKYNNLIPRATYNLDYKIKTTTKDKKIYVNCYLERVRMINKPPTVDQGEELEL